MAVQETRTELHSVLLAVTAVGVAATDEERRTSSEQYYSHSPVTVILEIPLPII